MPRYEGVYWAKVALWVLFAVVVMLTLTSVFPLPTWVELIYDADVSFKYGILTLNVVAWFVTAYGLTRR